MDRKEGGKGERKEVDRAYGEAGKGGKVGRKKEREEGEGEGEGRGGERKEKGGEGRKERLGREGKREEKQIHNCHTEFIR